MPEERIQIRLPADSALKGVVRVAVRYAAGLSGLRQAEASRLTAALTAGFRGCASAGKRERSNGAVSIVLETEESALRATLSHGRGAPVLDIASPKRDGGSQTHRRRPPAGAGSRAARGSPRSARRRV